MVADKIIRKTGLAPGSVVFVGKKKTKEVKVETIYYDKDSYEVLPGIDIKKKQTKWINVTGLHQTEKIEEIGNMFSLHPLVMEDIVNPNQRAKVEDYEDYLFIVLKMIYIKNKAKNITTEQISFVLGKDYIICFQECEQDVFDPIRYRLEKGKGRIRKSGADYLAYALMDAVIDNYFLVLEAIGDSIEKLELEVFGKQPQNALTSIHRLKRDLISLRKSVWPLREVISALQRDDYAIIQKSTKLYLRDLYDHTIQVIDTVESFRDTLSGILDIQLSNTSNRMNEVMKVLTIIATIFIPLTFIAGIYGMNFEFMPELHIRWFYPMLWGIMAAIVFMMLFYFRKKRWI